MSLSGGSGILLCCIFTLFSYVYGVLWWKFEISENIRLSDETFASFSDCDSGVKCSARCHTERFCGFAQYSSQGKACELISTQVCGSDAVASQWNLYKRIPIDITGYLVHNGATVIPPDAVTQFNANNSIDGVINTFSYTQSGQGSWWAMEFDSVWPIAEVTVTYFRAYNQMLYIHMSGTQFEDGPCSGVSGMYGVKICSYLPPSGCWHDALSINITSLNPVLGLKLFEIKIYS